MPAPYTAGQVMDTAAALLNDAQQAIFDYTAQLPFLKMVMRDLDQELTDIGCPINLISEYTYTLAAGLTALPLPESFFLPIKLQEKGTTDTFYSNMDEVSDVTEEDLEQTSILGIWDFRHNDINLVGSTDIRIVNLQYWRLLTELVDEDSLSEVAGAHNYLARKTASYCARYIGGNTTRADALALEAMGSLDLIQSLAIKNKQGIRVRRKPFRRGVGIIHSVRIP